jgi:hypothetical protein
MASEPLPPVLGIPTLEPGWVEITAPALAPLPPLAGGARFLPTSSEAPRPAPPRLRPEPAGPEPPPTEGGGGTMLFASSVPRAVPKPPPLLPVPPPAPEREGGGGTTLGAPSVGPDEDDAGRIPVLPDTPAEGGGATTFEPRAAPKPLRVPCGMPPAVLAPTAGGGGRTLAASDARMTPFEPWAFTDGGGGTTSVAPKIFPIRLLMKDPLPVCVGGGGTTVLDESGIVPASRCGSCEMSAEGGGDTTEGAGKFSLGSRVAARSGAETGGGTISALICTGDWENSRLTAPGAGGITLAARAGLERA